MRPGGNSSGVAEGVPSVAVEEEVEERQLSVGRPAAWVAVEVVSPVWAGEALAAVRPMVGRWLHAPVESSSFPSSVLCSN